MRRALDTGDNADYVIQADTPFDLAWAVNQSTGNISAYHSNRGNVRFFIPSPPEPEPEPEIVEPEEEEVEEPEEEEKEDVVEEPVEDSDDDQVIADETEDEET